MNASSSSSGGGGGAAGGAAAAGEGGGETMEDIVKSLQQAAESGTFSDIEDLALANPSVLLTTIGEEKNTCLHIACKKGRDREEFCEKVLAMNGSLLTAVNKDGETPLLVAVKNRHISLARYLLRWCRYLRLSAAVLKQDKDGYNALHRAILVADRSSTGPHCKIVSLRTCRPPACGGCHAKLALELLEAEPALSQAVNKHGESPMFLAVNSRYCAVYVLEKLVKTPGAWSKGGHGHNALHPTAASVVVRREEAGTVTTTTSDPTAGMRRRLMKAAATGNVCTVISTCAVTDAVLCETKNDMGNNCLHIAAMRGHKLFCWAILCCRVRRRDQASRRRHLLGDVNTDGETPLLAAVASGHICLAYFLLCKYDDDDTAAAILKQDKHGFNVLHHAIRSSHRKLAMKLIAKAPDLSRAVSRHGESPMFIAAMRDYEDVFNRLLKAATPNDDAAYVGAGGYNVLHAAVRNGNEVIAKRIMQTPHGSSLATEENMLKQTPVHLAVFLDQSDVLRVLLEDKPSLGYACSSAGDPLLNIAARRGQVSAARVLLEHCPDAPYATQSGWTCLHQAVQSDQLEFVKFVLKSPQLRKLVNMRDEDGRTPMHHTVLDCRPQMLEALLARPRHTDVTVLTNKGHHASWTLGDAIKSAKSLRWNEVSKLLLRADPNREKHIDDLHKEILGKITDESRKNIKALTETYIRNTSVVAILMASITFAAAFAFSGWYKNDDAITAKKSLRAFFIFDSLAMCLSLFVAFISVIARWDDLEFLLCYRNITRKIMWLAYMATITAFATGLYTLLTPRLLWLAILICCLPVLVPALTCLFHTWFVRWWVRTSSETDLLDMV